MEKIMRINIDRLCELAGVGNSSKSSDLIKESTDFEGIFEADAEEPTEEAAELADEESEEAAANEVFEINEADLVKELRRMRVIMKENRKVKLTKQQDLQEAELRGIIDQEVKNVLKELQLNSSWIYGTKKPTRSKKGFTHQGAFLKGIGFK
tara:strand:- start:4445 stop:4900 length:456 start_codon:yes stop_codon:yes gene_type:complete